MDCLNILNTLQELSKTPAFDFKKKKVTNIENTFKEKIKKKNLSNKEIRTIFEDLGACNASILEIIKQYNAKEKLQRGRIYEIELMTVIAKALNLNEFFYYEQIPVVLPNKIKNLKIPTGIKYIYYSNDINNNWIILIAGGPTDGDSYILHTDENAKCEIKMPNAKLGEYDLTLEYNEKNKLILAHSKKTKDINWISYFINSFNQDKDFIDSLGSNYVLTDSSNKEQLIEATKYYFETNDIDIFLTTIKGKIIAFSPAEILFYLENDIKICNNERSEIRTTGRNRKRLIHSSLFMQKTADLITINEDGTCIIKKNDKNGFGFTKNKSRFKMNYIFHVIKDEYEETKDFIKFHISKIYENVPSISVHLKFKSISLSKIFKYKELYLNREV